MATAFQTITSSPTQLTYNYNGWDSMILTNLHATTAVVVGFYIILKDSSGGPTGNPLSYFLKNVKIPAGVSLKLEEDEFSYDNSKYLSYITFSGHSEGLNITTRRK